MSFPSKMIFPAVGSISLMIVRPSVVLPHPDSPTMPSVSPFLTVRSTPETACTCPTVCLNTPGLDREVLDELLDAKELVSPVGRRCGCRVRRRLRLGFRLGQDGSSTSAPTTCWAASSSAK